MNKRRLVVLSGAGISAQSGIKTFRDYNGLWEEYRIEQVASLDGWRANPALVLEFYNKRRAQLKDVKPNSAHTILKELEQYFTVDIITQNVDDLHQRAGSKSVLPIHGSLLSKCSSLDKSYVTYVNEDMQLSDLAPDGSVYRPNIVWFGEEVPLFEKAIAIAKQADIFVVVGTSLQVYPAANLLSYVPSPAPIYLIDLNPPVHLGARVEVITENATQGMEKLKRMLLEQYL